MVTGLAFTRIGKVILQKQREGGQLPWEAGSTAPTVPQLESYSYKLPP